LEESQRATQRGGATAAVVRPRLIFILLATAIYLAVGCLASAPFGTRTDEEYSLATTAHGVGYALSRAMSYELQAPLYFGILAAWREINASVWFARLFSLLCATAFVFVLAKIGSRIAPEIEPLPFAALAALNPFVVTAAFEIRLYALALLLSGLMWLAFEDGFVSGASRQSRVAFVLLAISGIYVQYFLAFMLVGFGCSLLVLWRPKVFRAYLACASVVALAALPLAIAAHSQLGGYETGTAPPLWPLVMGVAAHPLIEFLFPRDFAWNTVPVERFAYHAVVVSTVLVLAIARPRFSRKSVALVASAAGVQLTYVALAAALALQLNGRYFVALFVPVAAASYGVFQAVRLGPRPKLSWAFASIVALTLLTLFSQYRFLAPPGDWKRVAGYLESHATPGDVIAIFPADGLPAFERQYRGSVRVEPFPRPYSTEQYSVRVLSINSPAEARAAFAKLAGYRRIWFVDGTPCPADDQEYGCANLVPVLASEFRAPAERAFYRNTLYELLRLGPQTHPQSVR